MSSNYNYTNFYQLLIANSKESPSKVIIYEDDLKISNKDLLSYVDTIASYLHDCGIGPGDKVGLVMANSWQFIVNFFAISKVGGVVVAINNFLKEDEISYILNDSQAKLLFASAKFDKDIRDQIIKTNISKIIWHGGAPIENDKNIDYDKLIACAKNSASQYDKPATELSIIVYTSGTTGKPKGAMISYNNIHSNVTACLEYLRVKHGGIKMVCYLPMFHSLTLTVSIILPIFSNSGVVIIRSIATKKDFAQLLKHVLLKRIPYFIGVPDIYNALAKAKLPWYFHWFHNVRGFISGAAPLPEATIKRFSESFKRGTLIEGYGISECSPVVSVNLPWANKPGSVGRPLPTYQVECFGEDLAQLPRGEIGEICVKGDCVMLGYYNRPSETKDAIIDGWFHTGDIGKIDEDGYVYIVDRKKDLIIHKGMNIYPREIEEILYTHEKVNACAVIGLKDSDASEFPVAYIELKEEINATEAEFKDYLKPRLATFKQPRKIIFIDKLPRNATGKILKRELRDF